MHSCQRRLGSSHSLRDTHIKQQHDLTALNVEQMTRVYPHYTHYNSSNYDPIVLWEAGVQVSAVQLLFSCLHDW